MMAFYTILNALTLTSQPLLQRPIFAAFAQKALAFRCQKARGRNCVDEMVIFSGRLTTPWGGISGPSQPSQAFSQVDASALIC
jgi:hypothetical protein